MDLFAPKRLWGQKLNVNGTIYTIGADGFVPDMLEADGTKVLKITGWMHPAVHQKHPAPSHTAPAVPSEPKAEFTPAPAPPPPSSASAIEPVATIAPVVGPVDTKPVGSDVEPLVVTEKTSLKEIVDATIAATPAQAPGEVKTATYPAEPAEGEEWPDPEESMDLGYLQKMADAYEVKFDPKTSKKTLAKRIHQAMYE